MKQICLKKRCKFIFFLLYLTLFVNSIDQPQNTIRKHIKHTQENIDQELIFLNDLDYHKTPSKLNYNKGFQDGITDEFKARLFSYKWAKSKKLNLVINSVKNSTEKLSNWKNFVISMSNNRGVKIQKKVCFPQNPSDNYGLVIEVNKKCAKKLSQVERYLNNSVNMKVSHNTFNDNTGMDNNHFNMKDKLMNPKSNIKRVHHKKSEIKRNILYKKTHKIPQKRQIITNRKQEQKKVKKIIPRKAFSRNSNHKKNPINNGQKNINEVYNNLNQSSYLTKTHTYSNVEKNRTNSGESSNHIPPTKMNVISGYKTKLNADFNSKIFRNNTNSNQYNNSLYESSKMNPESNYPNTNYEVNGPTSIHNDYPAKPVRNIINPEEKPNKYPNKTQYSTQQLNSGMGKNLNKNFSMNDGVPINFEEVRALNPELRENVPQNHSRNQQENRIDSDNQSVPFDKKSLIPNTMMNHNSNQGDLESTVPERTESLTNNSSNDINNNLNNPYFERVKRVRDYTVNRKERSNPHIVNKNMQPSKTKTNQLKKSTLRKLEDAHLNGKNQPQIAESNSNNPKSISLSRGKTYNNLAENSSKMSLQTGKEKDANLLSEEQHLNSPENLNDLEPLNDEQYIMNKIPNSSANNTIPNAEINKSKFVGNNHKLSKNSQNRFEEVVNNPLRTNSTNVNEENGDADFDKYLKEEKMIDDAKTYAPSRINKFIAEKYISSYKAKIFLF